MGKESSSAVCLSFLQKLFLTQDHSRVCGEKVTKIPYHSCPQIVYNLVERNIPAGDYNMRENDPQKNEWVILSGRLSDGFPVEMAFRKVYDAVRLRKNEWFLQILIQQNILGRRYF